MIGVTDIASRLGLRRVIGRREWRGTCPQCAYHDAFVLRERAGQPIGWCASCRDRNAIAHLLPGDTTAAAVPRANADDKQQRQRARDCAIALWNGSDPAVGTTADIYLAARGLPGLAASPALRFRLDCPHPGGGKFAALVAIFMDVTGTPSAIHRTFLAGDGSRKAAVEPQKATLGPVWGSAIRLDPLAPEVVIGEGIESSASAGRILGLPAWAAFSAGNLARGLVPPPEVRSVVIAADHDAVDPQGRKPGQDAARAATLRWHAEGRHVRIAMPDIEGHDFNDVLRVRVVEVTHA